MSGHERRAASGRAGAGLRDHRAIGEREELGGDLVNLGEGGVAEAPQGNLLALRLRRHVCYFRACATCGTPLVAR